MKNVIYEKYVGWLHCSGPVVRKNVMEEGQGAKTGERGKFAK